ncbi:hypothetical protein TRVA0_027S01002 [Trichomonascus vanleenenianus]|uniref:U2-type spliceosomal complex subunit CWC22 n=1 Tax=Trichomonascus vanleenenianus TaxID=2268995 RepID=UPI003EC9A209
MAEESDKPVAVRDVNPGRALERERQMEERSGEQEEAKKPAYDPAEEYRKLLELKSGGRYIPPAKLRALQEQIAKSQSPQERQRMEWEKLKKALNGLINKVNADNIKTIVVDIFKLNLVRAKGVFIRSVMKAQSVSLGYTDVYASLIAVINSKLPEVGKLLVDRLVIQFRQAFRRNNKAACLSSTKFLAHLCNQKVCHEIIVLEILHLLLEKPTNDSVEISIGFIREVGAYLQEVSPVAANSVFERYRAILHEGELEKRTQYMIEVLFQVRKDGYLENRPVREELDLVEEEEQITHMVQLDDRSLKADNTLNIFQFDPDYEANEDKYARIRDEILGGNEEEESEEDISVTDSEEEEEKEEEGHKKADESGQVEIHDMTGTDLKNLRKTIYLTIMSSMSTDEISHKLMQLDIPHEKFQIEIVNMLVESCAQEKIYNKIYGGVADRVCRLSRHWHDLFQQSFKHYYEVIHRYNTNQTRNIATMFGHVLASDGLGWEVFEVVKMTEEDSTSATRIYIKALFEEMKRELGIPKLVSRFKEEYLQPYLVNMFPVTRPSETRFAINYFTAIGLGALTEKMREELEKMPPSDDESEEDRGRSRSRSSNRSYSSRSRSYSDSRSPRPRRTPSSSRSYSGSRSPRPRRRRSYSSSRSPPPRRGRSYSPRRGRSNSPRDRSYSSSRGRSYSRSPSSRRRSFSRGRSDSRSPRRRSRSYSDSRSPRRSPPRRNRSYSGSRSPPRRGRSISSRESRDSRRRSYSSRSSDYSRSPPRRTSRPRRDRSRSGSAYSSRNERRGYSRSRSPRRNEDRPSDSNASTKPTRSPRPSPPRSPKRPKRATAADYL